MRLLVKSSIAGCTIDSEDAQRLRYYPESTGTLMFEATEMDVLYRPIVLWDHDPERVLRPTSLVGLEVVSVEIDDPRLQV